jgi:hypothetical protein
MTNVHAKIERSIPNSALHSWRRLPACLRARVRPARSPAAMVAFAPSPPCTQCSHANCYHCHMLTRCTACACRLAPHCNWPTVAAAGPPAVAHATCPWLCVPLQWRVARRRYASALPQCIAHPRLSVFVLRLSLSLVHPSAHPSIGRLVFLFVCLSVCPSVCPCCCVHMLDRVCGTRCRARATRAPGP